MCVQDASALLQLGSAGLKAGVGWQQRRFEAAMQRENARLADRAAREELDAGAAAASAILAEGRRVAGAQRVGMAALGGTEGTVSADNVIGDTAYFSALDASQTIENAGQRAADLHAEAGARRATARNLKAFAPLEAGGTLLTGGSRAYGIWKGLE